MTETIPHTYTSFDGHRRIASGSLEANALVVRRALASSAPGPVLIFDDRTGRSIDVDMRGTEEEMSARLRAGSPSAPTEPDTAPQGRGRPKLGVVGREVTLLPRHWEWLASQPGGASVALRKLVDEARRGSGDKEKTRKAQERAYHFMVAIAGDLPGFEEATRALFASDRQKFENQIEGWPGDVREHAKRLAFGE